MRYYQPERRIVVDRLAPAEAKFFLDVGCACGHVTNYLMETRGIRGVGVEINTALLAEARTYYPGLHNLVSGSGTALPFGDGSFDMVVLLEVLEHVPDEKGLIAEIARVLKPSGWLILSVPNRSLISLIDMNRAKFYFLTLHRMVYWAKHRGNMEGYRREETNHRHYSLRELAALLKGHFEIQKHIYSGSFAYVVLGILFGFLPDIGKFGAKKDELLVRAFRADWGSASANLSLAARRALL